MAAMAAADVPPGRVDGYELSQSELVRIGSELAALVSGIQWQLSNDRRELWALRQQVLSAQPWALKQHVMCTQPSRAAEQFGQKLSASARPYQPDLKPEFASVRHSMSSVAERSCPGGHSLSSVAERSCPVGHSMFSRVERPAPVERSLLSVVERLRADLITKPHFSFATPIESRGPTSGKHDTCCSSDTADRSEPPSGIGLRTDTENNTDSVTMAESSSVQVPDVAHGIQPVLCSGQVPDVANATQPASSCPGVAISAALETKDVSLVAKDAADSDVASWTTESAYQDAKHEASPMLALPSVGSAGHSAATCTPCAFLHTTGCSLGQNCNFCHLCDATEEEKRWKLKGLSIDAGSEQPSAVLKPTLERTAEPSTSASSEQCHDSSSNTPEQTEEVTPSVRSKTKWCDLVSDEEFESDDNVASSLLAKTRSKSVDHRLTSQRKLDSSSASLAPWRYSGQRMSAGTADAEQGAKARLGMPLAEIKERLRGTWTRQGELYEIDFSSWSCTKQSRAETDGRRKFKLRWNQDEDCIDWGTTYRLHLSSLRENPCKVHWQSKKDARHFQWERKL
eukprot:TRINITY_DN27818_c0_g1_i1.p1 TRINITY_DN27818_c0_g1~~TRINITY_DN27818_c0_g1_i1.p1  ORF type:complete len:569 (-),score=101.45 TRINITY_DN27818_c0_g1_i1:105-1811(-)